MRITSLLMALVLAGGLFLWFGGASMLGLVPEPGPAEGPGAEGEPVAEAEPTPAERAPVSVIVLGSTAQDYVAEIVLRGRTEAHRLVDVSAETSGLVISEPLRRGTVVSKGDVLCKLDIGTREAELAEAEARLAEAEAEFNAADRLSTRGYASETQAIATKAALEAAQAGVRRVMLDLERLTIRAPFDGILESDSAELGSLLSTGGVCATVIDLSPIKVSGFVSETEVGALSVGQPAVAHLIDGSVHEGNISYIARSADPETRTFRVEVTVPNDNDSIRDGMTAEIRISLPPVHAHMIPQTALTLDDDGRLGIRAVEDGKVVFHPVQILRDRSDGIWLAGLPDELDVIVRGQEFVRAGGAVTAVPFSTDMLEGMGQ